MLITLPLIAFVLLTITLHGRNLARQSTDSDWKTAFLRSVVVWGLVAAISLELLSPFNLVGRTSLVVLWSLAALAVGVWGWRARYLARGWASARQLGSGMSTTEWVLAGGAGALLTSVMAVALISPPNNVDSSLYHLARVMHWVQNGSLSHYAAKYHHQLNRPPFAEMAILHLRVLWGSDRPAALVQWFSLVASLVAVARISHQLEIGRWGRWVAVAFVVGLPMSMLQGSSTQNDLVVGLWIVVALSLLLEYIRTPNWHMAGWLGAALGLGLLTKATGYIYALPFALLLVALRIRPGRLASAAAHGAIMVAIVGGLNAGYWARNQATYGTPLGGIRDIGQNLSFTPGPSPAQLNDEVQAAGLLHVMPSGPGSQHINLSLQPAVSWARSVASAPLQPAMLGESDIGLLGQDGPDEGPAVITWVLGRARKAFGDLMLHFVTPSSAIEAIQVQMLQRIDFMFDNSFFRQRAQIAWNHEDTAGNPVQLALVLASLALVLTRPRQHRRTFWVYLTVMVLGFGMVLIFGDRSSRWALRYHLPFFLAAGPLVGYASGMLFGPRLRQILAGLCLVVALPWLLLNNTRPLIGMPPWPTRVESVLVEDPVRLMFATAPELQDEAEAAAAAIRSSSCTRVGLWLESKEPEYPIWWLLDAPQSGIQLKNVHTYDSLEGYLDPDFEPCLVLCTLCGGDETALGLPLVHDYSHYRIYGIPEPTSQ